MTDSNAASALFDLLPMIYRQRDARDDGAPGPLQVLLAVLAEEMHAVDAELDQLYANWFVETCEERFLPFIADLIRYEPLPAELRAIAEGTPRSVPPFLRRSLASAMSERRRRGTPTQVDRLGPLVAGWPSLLCEAASLIACTVDVDVPQGASIATFRVDDPAACADVGTVFDTAPRTMLISAPEPGDEAVWPEPLTAVLGVWRTDTDRVVRVPARRAIGGDRRRFHLDWLGHDTALLPAQPGSRPLSRQHLATSLAAHYGQDRSVYIWIDNKPVPVKRIQITDLDSWGLPANNTVSLDPETGRITLARDVTDVSVTYHRGREGRIGGGAYVRPATETAWNWNEVETMSPGRHKLPNLISVAPNRRRLMQASDSGRVELVAHRPNRRHVRVRGPSADAAPASFGLSGLLIDGSLHVQGNLDELVVADCTLVRGQAPTIVVEGQLRRLRIERCIIGGIKVISDTDVEIIVRDSAIAAGPTSSIEVSGGAAARVDLRRVTALGAVVAPHIDAADSLLVGGARSSRNGAASGRVTYSWVPDDAAVGRGPGCPPGGDADATRPVFVSRNYGHPRYLRLAASCPVPIRRGAQDGAELGTFHHLDEATRTDSLSRRLAESLPVAMVSRIVQAG